MKSRLQPRNSCIARRNLVNQRQACPFPRERICSHLLPSPSACTPAAAASGITRRDRYLCRKLATVARRKGMRPMGAGLGTPEGAPLNGMLETLDAASIKVEAFTRPTWFLLFLLCCWVIAIDNKLALRMMPPIPHLFGPKTVTKVSTFQMLPTSRHVAWQLGHIAGEVHTALSRDGARDVTHLTPELQALCDQAAPLLRIPAEQVTPELLLQLGPAIASHEQTNGVMARVRGLFKFANLMWLVGILGVTISIGPAMYVLFGPLIQVLLIWAKTLVLYAHVFARPFYYGAALYGCLTIISASQLQTEPAGSRLALTGVALASTLVYFAIAPLSSSISSSTVFGLKFSPQMLVLAINAFPLIALTPLAVAHQSQLLGFFAVTALFGALGFVVVPTGCGWLVGWTGYGQMLNTAIASTILILLSMGAKALNVNHMFLAPFQLGLNVFGTNCLLLAGLIMSSRYYTAMGGYYLWNGAYAALLTALCLGGAWLGMDSVFAVGSTYTALWLSEKALELAIVEGLGWVAILMGSMMLCGGGYFIHTHPDWLTKILS